MIGASKGKLRVHCADRSSTKNGLGLDRLVAMVETMRGYFRPATRGRSEWRQYGLGVGRCSRPS